MSNTSYSYYHNFIKPDIADIYKKIICCQTAGLPSESPAQFHKLCHETPLWELSLYKSDLWSMPYLHTLSVSVSLSKDTDMVHTLVEVLISVKKPPSELKRYGQ